MNGGAPLLKILKYLSNKEWGLVITSLVLIILQVWLDLSLPERMGQITRLVQTPGTAMSEIISAGRAMLLITLGSVVMAVVVAGLAARISSSLAARLRANIYNRVQSFSTKEVNDFTVSSLITRSTNDVAQVQGLMMVGLQILARSPILAVWATIKIMDMSWQWSAATGLAVAALVIISTLFIGLAIPKFRLLQEQTDDLNRVSREQLTGIRVVRAYNAEAFQEAKFARSNRALARTNLHTNRLMAYLWPCIELLMNGLTLSAFWIGAVLIAATVGAQRLALFSDMMAFSFYSIQLLVAFMLLVMIFMMLPRASVAAKRINEVLETEPTILDGKLIGAHGAKIGEVEFRDVSFKYPDAEDYVLKDISFKAHKGETVAFIGATGCGKSTIVNLIPRFFDVTAGAILVADVNVKDYMQASLRDKIGYVGQKAILLSGTISSNVAFGANGNDEIKREDIVSAVAAAQATEFVESMASGYDSDVAPGGSTFSGGQKQRISIARAMAKKPEILIFDDSFSALDYKTDRMLRSELKKAAVGTTIFIVGQRIGTVKEADKIIVLEEGRIAGIGTHHELLQNCPVYQEIAYSQLSREELAGD